jgi:hypothetical protein
VLTVRHDGHEVAQSPEGGEIVGGSPAVEEEAVIPEWAGELGRAVDDGDADGAASCPQRTRRFTIPSRQAVAIVDVDVLDVELPPPIAMLPAFVDHRPRSTIPSGGVREQPPQGWLMEALVHEQRHHLHVALPGEVEYPAVDTPPQDAETVHPVPADGEDIDPVRVLNEALVAVFAIHIIEKALERGLRLEESRKQEGETQSGAHRGLLG